MEDIGTPGHRIGVDHPRQLGSPATRESSDFGDPSESSDFGDPRESSDLGDPGESSDLGRS